MCQPGRLPRPLGLVGLQVLCAGCALFCLATCINLTESSGGGKVCTWLLV